MIKYSKLLLEKLKIVHTFLLIMTYNYEFFFFFDTCVFPSVSPLNQEHGLMLKQKILLQRNKSNVIAEVLDA